MEDDANIGNSLATLVKTLTTLMRMVACAVSSFLCCSLVWFPFWYAIAWISFGKPPVLSEIPVVRFSGDPTWLLFIWSFPILGALHGLVKGADRRIPLFQVNWQALRGSLAASAIFGQGAEIGCALLAILLLLPAIGGAVLGAWLCSLIGGTEGGMPGFVAGAILGLFGLNLVVIHLSSDSTATETMPTPSEISVRPLSRPTDLNKNEDPGTG